MRYYKNVVFWFTKRCLHLQHSQWRLLVRPLTPVCIRRQDVTTKIIMRYILIYRMSQEECARLREGVPYVKVYRYNPKHLCPKLNGYGDNGQRKVWSSYASTHCTSHLTLSALACGVKLRLVSRDKRLHMGLTCLRVICSAVYRSVVNGWQVIVRSC